MPATEPMAGGADLALTSQPVRELLAAAAIFLVMTVNPGGESAVRELLADLAGLQRSVGFRIPEGRPACVAGIGSAAWDRLSGGPRPAELHPFPELSGDRHRAVATPGDLLFHIKASRLDLCFEFAAQVLNRLAGLVTVRDEAQGFRYFDQRDLMGFVDGTENPDGLAAIAAALVGDADPGGGQQQILRANMPFGAPGRGEYGTYYIAYAATPAVTEQMLANMFIGSPPGNYDRILDFSTAVTGGLFFAPAAGFLDDLPDPPKASSSPFSARDGSLGIGGLKGSTGP